jgi:ADP-dependent NAD(P)H-hydrate dehydratase / NAD(P)H-hydrate epimerase
MIPLYSAQQVREADSYAINSLGIPSIILMENASRSIFEIITQQCAEYIENKNIGIVCGKGNNGGDGFAVARHFINDSFDVRIIALGAEEELKGDALINFRILKNLLNEYPQSKLLVFDHSRELSILDDCSLVIDAMLGTGTRGAIGEPHKTIVEKLNQLNAYRIAVDLPTGLDLENSSGEIIFKADMTITLSEYKTGLFYGKGYINAGNIFKGSIGIGDEYYQKLKVSEYLIEPEDAFFGLPIKDLDAQKYSAGKVFVVAGSGKMPGASFFTTNTVLKSGAGACYLAFPDSIKTLAQQKLDAAIVASYNDESKQYLSKNNLDELSPKIDWADVVAIGPGLGREEETQNAVRQIMHSYKTKKFVIDADAVFALGKDEYKKVNLKGKILTPHHKEFASMVGIEIHELENNLLSIGKTFASENSCYLVLKGAPTIIFNPDGESFINSTGNPGMAKFGTGDVLTGLIASFLAQSEEIEDALISAVYIHSLACDLLMEEKTEFGFTASDIIEKIPYAIKFIINSFVQNT